MYQYAYCTFLGHLKYQIYKSIRHLKSTKSLKFAPQFVTQNIRYDFHVFGRKLPYMSRDIWKYPKNVMFWPIISTRQSKTGKFLKFAPQFVTQNIRHDFYVFRNKFSYMSRDFSKCPKNVMFWPLKIEFPVRISKNMILKHDIWSKKMAYNVIFYDILTKNHDIFPKNMTIFRHLK